MDMISQTELGERYGLVGQELLNFVKAEQDKERTARALERELEKERVELEKERVERDRETARIQAELEKARDERESLLIEKKI